MARVLPFASLPLFAALGCGFAIALAGCDRQSATDAQPQEEATRPASGELTGTIDRQFAGDPMPDFTFTDPDGKELSLTGLQGKPVLLNLWATWCAPCVVEMPMLDDLAGEYSGKVRVVTVSQDMKGAELVAPFFAEKGFKHLEPWLDTKSDLAFHYEGGAVLPTTILYDAQGKEVWRMVGGYEWDSEPAHALVEEVLPRPAG
jgi:thiol-disulfide isomerase/thioredoxin